MEPYHSTESEDSLSFFGSQQNGNFLKETSGKSPCDDIKGGLKDERQHLASRNYLQGKILL